MKLILAISFALATFSGTLAVPGQPSSQPLLPYHVRFFEGKCQVLYTKDTVKRVPGVSQEDCNKQLNKSPITQVAEYDQESQECVITTKNDFQVETLSPATSGEECTELAKGFFKDNVKNGVSSPFLKVPTWHQETTSRFAGESAKYNAALNICKAKVTGGVDIIFKYDERVKEIESLKNKIFDRTIGATKRKQSIVWDYTMNDGIGFRIILDTIAAPGLSKPFAECLQRELQATGLRTQDGGLTWFMSGKINVPSLNIYNPDPENSVVEYQMWPLATGTWMLWQHDRFYKLPEHLKEGARRTYVKSLQMAAMCMDDAEFVKGILPQIKTKGALKQWLTIKCNRFLMYKHRIAQDKAKSKAQKDGKPFKPKAYEPKSETFDLTHPTVDPPIESSDLIDIVWEQVEKARALSAIDVSGVPE